MRSHYRILTDGEEAFVEAMKKYAPVDVETKLKDLASQAFAKHVDAPIRSSIKKPKRKKRGK